MTLTASMSNTPTPFTPTLERVITARICAAIDRMRSHPNLPVGYWENTLRQRMPGGAGSTVTEAEHFGGYQLEVPRDTAELERALRDAYWAPYEHANLAPGTTAFRTSCIHGLLGVVCLAEMPGSTEVTLDDRKGTGTVSATVHGAALAREEVDFTVLILGDEAGEEVVFTFHPGAPVRPSTVKAEAGLHGKKVTAKAALAMGLTTAKVV